VQALRDPGHESYREPPQGFPIATIDPATGVGADSSVALFWRGNLCVDHIESKQLDTMQFSEQILDKMRRWKINRAIVDCDGVGVSVADALTKQKVKVERFHSNARDKIYANAKTAAFFKLKDEGIVLTNHTACIKQQLARELGAIRWRVLKGGDGKIALAPKDDAKRQLGHSPDFADAAALRGAVREKKVHVSF
jgi:hypothetical protein